MCVVFVSDPVEEKRRLDDRLNALQTFASSSAGNFWNDNDKGMTVALFQDRIEHCRKLLVRCRDCLDYLHNCLYPLNPCLDGLVKLLEKFRDGSRILKFIYREMISGAWAALARVKIHHPQINLDIIAEGFPAGSPPEVDMRPFYDVTFEPARKIIRQDHAMTRRIRRTQGRDIPEMSCIPELAISDISIEVAERRRAFEGR